MSSIKEICQLFCFRQNLTPPSTFVGVTSPAERQYLQIFRAIGDMLRNRPYQWPQLKRGYTFTVTSGQTKYQLPGDFYRLLDTSQWDVTNQWPLKGPLSDLAFNLRAYAAVSLQSRKAYHIIGPTNYLIQTSPWSARSAGWFEIDPAPDNSTDQLYIGYLSCNWIQPKDWVSGTVYAAGSLVSGVGYVYHTAAGGTAGATRPNHASGSASDGAVTWAVYNEPHQVTEENTKLSDSDICLFDDDIMIDGMCWYYLKLKGLDFQQSRADWEQQVKSAAARQKGITRVNMANELESDSDEWPYTDPGSWSV